MMALAGGRAGGGAVRAHGRSGAGCVEGSTLARAYHDGQAQGTGRQARGRDEIAWWWWMDGARAYDEPHLFD